MKNTRIKELRFLILDAKHKYYCLGAADLSDQAYDKLEFELRDLSPNDPLLDAVGCPTCSKNVRVFTVDEAIQQHKILKTGAYRYREV